MGDLSSVVECVVYGDDLLILVKVSSRFELELRSTGCMGIVNVVRPK